MKSYILALSRFFFVVLGILVLIAAVNFPYHYDAPLTRQEIDAAQKYYSNAYLKTAEPRQTQGGHETQYLRLAVQATKDFAIEEQVGAFVDRYNLKDKAVLEVGSGRGHLQDFVEDYTGLDISPTVAPLYHKKFVLGSATALPFADNTFDALWSIWVFEHVPNPEQAFSEARRVTRNGGVLFLLPAWNAPVWAADGYSVRPYSDFGPVGKLIKASVPLRTTLGFKAATVLPVRMIRSLATFGPSKLRYRRLKPNYEQYWVVDSDAVNSIDSYEALLWFTSRGDECLNCGADPLFFPVAHTPLIIRVQKSN
jgi:SAM-dependent methyltransferase